MVLFFFFLIPKLDFSMSLPHPKCSWDRFYILDQELLKMNESCQVNFCHFQFDYFPVHSLKDVSSGISWEVNSLLLSNVVLLVTPIHTHQIIQWSNWSYQPRRVKSSMSFLQSSWSQLLTNGCLPHTPAHRRPRMFSVVVIDQGESNAIPRNQSARPILLSRTRNNNWLKIGWTLFFVAPLRKIFWKRNPLL